MRAKPPPRRSARRPPRLRPLLALRRRPRVWWAAVLTVALGAGWSVSTVVADAQEAARRWQGEVTVVVAARDLEPGDEIGTGDVRLVERPREMVPEGALSELPTGQVVRAAVFEGEALIGGRLAPAGLRGLAALLPDGASAVAIPVEPDTAPPLQRGDSVDVLVSLAPEAAGGGPPGFALVTGAAVLDVGEHAVTIAVDRAAAPRVAVALASGAVTLALAGP